MNFSLAYFQTIHADWLSQKNISLDVLRLDKIHSVISGNKHFKLKYYFQDAVTQNKTTVATFGGAWSNHIVAAAYACKEASLKSVGFIRGEKPVIFSSTLMQAEEYGMELIFVSREQYRNKQQIINNCNKDLYWINEGGYGNLGVKGAAEIAADYNLSGYTHIIAAVGTGTMLAGLVQSAESEQQIIGISAMKGNETLKDDILNVLDEKHHKKKFTVLHSYHFGGYGKHPATLINFMNEIYNQHNLPLDIVYTGKTFYAICDLVEKNHFKAGDKLLMIHSGGLQGNAGAGKKLLAY